MAEPIKPLYDAMLDAQKGLRDAQATYESRLAALVAAMPEGVEFDTRDAAHTHIKRVGTKVMKVNHQFIGDPTPEASAPS